MSDHDSTCPSPETLDQIAVGERVAEDVSAHVARCEACSAHIRAARFSRRFGAVMQDRGEPAPPDQPEVFGYELLGEISRGGQGVVYRARQIATGQAVAIKVLHSTNLSRSSRERFAREIRIAGSLSHPGIVRPFDSIRLSDGHEALVMELVEGVPLGEWVSARAYREPRALLDVLARVGDALQHAHQRGVIHRDLKPSNILIDGGNRPHVLDFGIATRTEPAELGERITRTGEFTGTLAYAAPEQVSGDTTAPDVRTDVYALGVIGFEMLSGRPPYDVAGSLDSVVRNITTRAPPSPTSSGLAADPWTVLTKAMAKAPERRYQSAAEFARDLRNAAHGRAIDARGDSRWYVFRKTVRRHRVPMSLALVFVAGLAAVLGVVSVGNSRLGAALHESRVHQVRAHVMADERDRAERVLWPELERLAGSELDAESALWTGPLRIRRLLWCFVEMQARATCLGVERGVASPASSLTPFDDGSFGFVTGEGRMARGRLLEDGFEATTGVELPPGARQVWFTPSGRHALVGLSDRFVTIETQSGREIASLELNAARGAPSSVAVAGWGVALMFRDGTIQLRSLPALDPIDEITGVRGSQNPWIDPHDPTLVLIGPDHRVHRWRAETGRTEPLVEEPVLDLDRPQPFPQLLLSPDGSLLVVAHGGGIMVRDLRSSESTPTLMSHPGYRVWVSHDPSWSMLAAGANGDPILHLWRTTDWERLPGLSGHQGAVAARAFSADGSRILTTDGAGTLRIWAAPGRAWTRSFGDPTGRAHQIAIDHTTERVWYADAMGQPRSFDRDGRSRPTELFDRIRQPMIRADWCASSSLLAWAGMDADIAIMRASGATEHLEAVRLGNDGVVAGMRFRPGRHADSLLAIATSDRRLLLVEPQTATIRDEITLPGVGRPSDLCWSPDGASVGVSLRDGHVAVIDVSAPRDAGLIRVSERQLRGVTYLAGSAHIAAVGDDGRLMLVDPSGRVTASERISEHSLFAIACHPNGLTIAVGDRAGVVTLLDARTLGALAAFDTGGSIMCLRFTSDGRSLFVSALEQPVQRWDLTRLAATLPDVRP